jgi:hypothetical protein
MKVMINLNSIIKKSIFVLTTTLIASNSYAEILGYVDRVDPQGDGALIRGWACDKKVNKSIDVHVYLGGAAVRVVKYLNLQLPMMSVKQL